MNQREEKEFYDLCYDVWRAGGNPDAVNRDNFEGHDFMDEGALQAELRRQRGPRRDEEESTDG